MNFKYSKSSVSSARRGSLKLYHGVVQTPFFMPIATKGTVKLLSAFDMEKIGAEILLANTYHLYLRPGIKVLERFNGLHKFMNWKKPILTDSGGYQVYSLSKIRNVTDKGVEFQSHIDGTKHLLTPEKAVQIQNHIGSDIVMVLDECVGYPAEKSEAEDAVRRTTEWAKRCKIEMGTNKKQVLFGIVQGSTFKDLRERSARELIELDFPGYAIGGLAVGEEAEKLIDMTEYTTGMLPEEKPRYLMGVGEPENILDSVSFGVDMFDCVIPSRNGRHGLLYNFKGNSDEEIIADMQEYRKTEIVFYDKIRIKNSRWKLDREPVDSSCDCELCSRYSAGYLHHLFSVSELLGMRFAAAHNINFYLRLMKLIQQGIKLGKI